MNDDTEHDDWVRFSMANLAAAYGDEEPEYTLAYIIEPNPDFEDHLWDKQIEAEAAAGKLDALAQESLDDYYAGRSTEICESDKSKK